mgnify:CR=1 FL=1
MKVVRGKRGRGQGPLSSPELHSTRDGHPHPVVVVVEDVDPTGASLIVGRQVGELKLHPITVSSS